MVVQFCMNPFIIIKKVSVDKFIDWSKAKKISYKLEKVLKFNFSLQWAKNHHRAKKTHADMAPKFCNCDQPVACFESHDDSKSTLNNLHLCSLVQKDLIEPKVGLSLITRQKVQIIAWTMSCSRYPTYLFTILLLQNSSNDVIEQYKISHSPGLCGFENVKLPAGRNSPKITANVHKFISPI